MIDKNSKKPNCFDEFNNISPKRQQPSIQVLYDYEKHYMELVRKYSHEISFVSNMIKSLRDEQTQFYNEILPNIIKRLNEDKGIDVDMKKIWIKRLTTNIDRSFTLSENLINDYATKNIDEFKNAVNEKLQKL